VHRSCCRLVGALEQSLLDVLPRPKGELPGQPGPGLTGLGTGGRREVAGDLGEFDCTYDYETCWTTEHYCDVVVKVRSGYVYNFYSPRKTKLRRYSDIE
jgi:hypothetical protein